MTPRKLNILFVFYSYAGNSTGTSEISALRQWFVPLIIKLKTDPWFVERIGTIDEQTIADTPITMTRNASVVLAREIGADILVMVDSDMVPDVHLKDDPTAVPFFETAFKELYEHYEKGPLVLAAPYGGCPPHENMFVFTWDAMMNAGEESRVQLRQYHRDEARRLAGTHEAAALPTGLIMYDMRAFELIEPSGKSREQVLDELLTGQITKTQALMDLREGWFSYEWEDSRAHKKASTEDVQNTRDISIAGQAVLGYNPVRCLWSSWAGHNKVWTVGKPQRYTVEEISSSFAKAVQNRDSIRARILNFNTDLPQFHNANGNGKVAVAPRKPADDPEFPPEILSKLQYSDNTGERLLSYKYMTGFDEFRCISNLVQQERERLGRKLRVIEVGSYVGESAVAMARTGCCERIICVDNFESIDPEWNEEITREIGGGDTIRKLFLRNTSRHKCIQLFEGKSEEAARKFLTAHGKGYDLIFIDADHEYESVKADIESWMPYVSDNGVMFGHDYGHSGYPGVGKAVHEIFGDHAGPLNETPIGRNFWIVRMSELPVKPKNRIFSEA